MSVAIGLLQMGVVYHGAEPGLMLSLYYTTINNIMYAVKTPRMLSAMPPNNRTPGVMTNDSNDHSVSE